MSARVAKGFEELCEQRTLAMLISGTMLYSWNVARLTTNPPGKRLSDIQYTLAIFLEMERLHFVTLRNLRDVRAKLRYDASTIEAVDERV